jgi:hypothetical protein
LQSEAATTRADAAWIAGSSGDAALAGAVETAIKRAADGWTQATAHHLREQAEAEAQAWQAALWAARQLALKAAPVLRAALVDMRIPATVRCEALRALAECGDASDQVLLVLLLSEVDPDVRAAASAALARLSAPAALPSLEKSTSMDGAALRPVLRAVLPNAEGRLLATTEQRQAGVANCAGTAGRCCVDSSRHHGG